ncbi:SecDF P1 head subdomain-containing protein [Streptomyces sp. 4N509B]|uniref:SecDF P1 head subdomain-containing protein n=1 Tax=Streptomyces sp. 4N509B TaxID=3457413 RepID=UPI003FD28753
MVASLALLTVLGVVLTILALRLSGGEEKGDLAAESAEGEGGVSDDGAAATGPAVLMEPLAFVPVRHALPGACGSPRPPVTLDDPDQGQCLTLDVASGMEVTRLAGPAEAVFSEASGGWAVRVTLLERDAVRFGELTERVAKEPAPANQLAMVLGEDMLLAAPLVTGRIDGGEVEISGGFDAQDAQAIAIELGAS